MLQMALDLFADMYMKVNTCTRTINIHVHAPVGGGFHINRFTEAMVQVDWSSYNHVDYAYMTFSDKKSYVFHRWALSL